MNRFNVINIILFLFLNIYHIRAQQEINFSHYMLNSQLFNPAFIGLEENLTISSLNSLQWVGFEGNPTTNTILLDGKLKNNLGIGMELISDKIGPTSSNFIAINAAYHLKLNKHSNNLSLGIKLSGNDHNIGLDSMPEFPAVPKNDPCLKGDIHFTDSIERMERAYDDWKSGTWSKDPFLDMMIPTATDPTMAPPGKHFMSCFVQYCPPKIYGKNWTNENKENFGETVIRQIEEYSPGFREKIIHMEIRTPKELEDEVGLTEGNIFQGELTFDQLLFNRPIPGYAQYRSPLKGLYICGSSTHPGGGVMGAPGRNAALEILKDLNKGTSHARRAYEVI